MDMNYTEDDLRFRDDVRAFIDEAFTPDLQQQMSRSKNGYMSKEAHITWQKRLHEKGWAAPNWPAEHGGAGFTPTQKFIFTGNGCRRRAAFHSFRFVHGGTCHYGFRLG